MWFFPAELPRKSEDKAPPSDTYYGHVRDLPKALYELVTNTTYMFISAGATMDGFLLAGESMQRVHYIDEFAAN